MYYAVFVRFITISQKGWELCLRNWMTATAVAFEFTVRLYVVFRGPRFTVLPTMLGATEGNEVSESIASEYGVSSP